MHREPDEPQGPDWPDHSAGDYITIRDPGGWLRRLDHARHDVYVVVKGGAMEYVPDADDVDDETSG